MATNKPDSAEQLKYVFSCYLKKKQKASSQRQIHFPVGKKNVKRLCWYAGKDNKAVTLFESCNALDPGEFHTTVLKEIARKTVKISDTCFDDFKTRKNKVSYKGYQLNYVTLHIAKH